MNSDSPKKWVSLIIILVGQFFVGVWYASRVDYQVTQNTKDIEPLKSQAVANAASNVAQDQKIKALQMQVERLENNLERHEQEDRYISAYQGGTHK